MMEARTETAGISMPARPMERINGSSMPTQRSRAAPERSLRPTSGERRLAAVKPLYARGVRGETRR
jgi:hypothetical protein